MNISPINISTVKFGLNNNKRYVCDVQSCDTVCFKGRIGAENYGKKGIDVLKKETGFFRDWETIQFVKKYIEEN